MNRLAAVVVMCSVAVSGCEPATAPTPSVLTAQLRDAGPLTRVLDVTLRDEAALTVEYWTTDGPRLRVESGVSSAHSILLTRLRADRTYDYEVPGTTHSGSFVTAPLPADLADVGLRATGTPTTPLVLVHLYRPEGFKGYAAVDREGEVVWYWRTDDLSFGAARRANGNFVFMDKGRGLVEVTPAGELVRELPQDTAQREQHHDVIVTPQNTVLFIAFDRRMHGGRLLKGEAIWEWVPESNTVTRRWSSWDFLSPDVDRGPRFGTEWLHANALGIGPRGNIIVSLHYLNQVISITSDWSALEWRLGGINPTIEVGPEDQFLGQHTAREIAPGRVILFDNRRDTGEPSRALELELNGARATRRWMWTAPSGNHAAVVSSARRLANGNTLVAFGTSAGTNGSSGPTEAYEVDPGGAVLWNLVVSNTFVMYRVEPLASVGGEVVVANGSVR